MYILEVALIHIIGWFIKKEGFVFLYESLLSFYQSDRLVIYSFKFTLFVELKLNVVG